MDFELLIENNGKIYAPLVLDGAAWTTERIGSPGKLTFTVAKDDIIDFQEGNPVRVSLDGKGLFYGFVFKKQRDKKHQIAVTAYDQLRYLKNKDTKNFRNVTASDIVRSIAGDYLLNIGDVDQTEFIIADRNEQNTALLDIIYNALDLEITNKGKMYVLFDDFGKLSLKSIDKMATDFLIDDTSGENFDYTTSIDDKTYNKIKLTYDDKGAGLRDVYIAQDGEHINDWGILQLLETLQEGENGQAKADALLELYNAKTRKIKVSKLFGDANVRAGCLVSAILGIGDMNVKNMMLVEKCVHTFEKGAHWMELTLRGGEFVA